MVLDIWFHRYDQNNRDVEGRCMFASIRDLTPY